jgi:hypothetical protein
MLAGDVGDYLDANGRRHPGTVVLADVSSGVVTVVASEEAARVDSSVPAEPPGSVESRLRSALQAAFSTRRGD